MTLYEELTQQLKGSVVELAAVISFTGVKSMRVAKEKAARNELPFPAFRTGGCKGIWHVKVADVAAYLEKQSAEYKKNYDKVNS
jgi:hypothetical protein